MDRLKDYIDPSWTKIFEIEGFAERMGSIRQVVRPGLQKLAAHLSDLLNRRDLVVFPHVASHMRRRVNPPHETWLALGPEKRGYKAYGHFGVFIGKEGGSVRFVIKDEAEGPKKALGTWLGHDRSARNWFSGTMDLRDFDAVHGMALPAPVLSRTPKELGERLSSFKTSGLDLGWPVPFSMPVEEIVGRLEMLSPLYRAANGS